MKSLILIAMVIAGFATQLPNAISTSGVTWTQSATPLPMPEYRPAIKLGSYDAAPGGDNEFQSAITVIGLPPSGERPTTTDRVGVCLQTADGRSWIARWEEMK